MRFLSPLVARILVVHGSPVHRRRKNLSRFVWERKPVGMILAPAEAEKNIRIATANNI